MPGQTVVTIGNFDGVHVGHAALLRAARRYADLHRLRVIALAFDPHPMTRLNPARAPRRLGGFERRAHWLRALGADDVQRLVPDDDLLSLSPDDFLRRIVHDLQPAALVEGRDFRFGKNRTGSVELLARLGPQLGFEPLIIPPVEVALSDCTLVTASSTIARWLVSHGRMRDATLVLGRPHEVVGQVVAGQRLGRVLGYPTANLHTDDLVPADGVYAGWASLPDQSRLPAAISVGTCPTFNGRDRLVEAFLLDLIPHPAGNIPGLPEYGWPLRLEFTRFIRDQIRLESPDALRQQIRRDVDRIRHLLLHTHAPLANPA
jgi:riboflavin kinase/FMN adenylyltransferase